MSDKDYQNATRLANGLIRSFILLMTCFMFRIVTVMILTGITVSPISSSIIISIFAKIELIISITCVLAQFKFTDNFYFKCCYRWDHHLSAFRNCTYRRIKSKLGVYICVFV